MFAPIVNIGNRDQGEYPLWGRFIPHPGDRPEDFIMDIAQAC